MKAPTTRYTLFWSVLVGWDE